MGTHKAQETKIPAATSAKTTGAQKVRVGEQPDGRRNGKVPVVAAEHTGRGKGKGAGRKDIVETAPLVDANGGGKQPVNQAYPHEGGVVEPGEGVLSDVRSYGGCEFGDRGKKETIITGGANYTEGSHAC
jgi:hypothetical protein